MSSMLCESERRKVSALAREARGMDRRASIGWCDAGAGAGEGGRGGKRTGPCAWSLSFESTLSRGRAAPQAGVWESGFDGRVIGTGVAWSRALETQGRVHAGEDGWPGAGISPGVLGPKKAAGSSCP